MELKYKNWKDITVNIFEKLKNIDYNKNDELESLDANITMLSILCDCDEDKISALTTGEFNRLLNETSFLKEMPKVNIEEKYVINGKEYKVFVSLKKMSVAQYIDFQTYYKDTDKYFKELLSIFLIPKGKNYCEDYDVDEVIKEIGEYLSIVDAKSILFFFCHLIAEFNKGYSGLFNKGFEEDVEEDKEQGRERKVEYGDNGNGESQSFSQKWSWVYLVDCVSETCRCEWSKVFNMNIYEFFNILSYRQDKKNEEKRQIEQYKRR